MFKSIKKLFSVDESDLDFDEIETSEDKSSMYKKSLEQEAVNTDTSEMSLKEMIEEHGNKIREVETNQPSFEQVIQEQPEKIITMPLEEFEKTSTDLFNSKPIENEIKANSKSFDFAKAIEDAYEKPYVPEEKVVEEEVPVKKVIESTKKEDELVSKDTYVLKDIISPMKGVIRKETKEIKRDEEVRKSQIIKLREQVKTTEIEPDIVDDYVETIEFTFTDTKNLDDTLREIPSEEVKDTLSETSKFTLIEDSTGEMRLVIDEDE